MVTKCKEGGINDDGFYLVLMGGSTIECLSRSLLCCQYCYNILHNKIESTIECLSRSLFVVSIVTTFYTTRSKKGSGSTSKVTWDKIDGGFIVVWYAILICAQGVIPFFMVKTWPHSQQNHLCKLKVDDITWRNTFTRLKFRTISLV